LPKGFFVTAKTLWFCVAKLLFPRLSFFRKKGFPRLLPAGKRLKIASAILVFPRLLCNGTKGFLKVPWGYYFRYFFFLPMKNEAMP